MAQVWHYFENHPSLYILSSSEIQGLFHSVNVGWLEFRDRYIARCVQYFSTFCVVLFVLPLLDRFIMCLGCLYIKVRQIRPTINGDPFQSDDVEGSLSDYPMVLVQIPMCNEREVYELSISAVCQLDWPKECLLIQVLDDSDDECIQCLIKTEVSKWNQKGINILYRHRLERTGYKAGNLKSGMSCDYVEYYEFVAIFDADFQPEPDFIKQTVPHFKDNPELAMVQARWTAVNKNKNLLTRLQYINMCFHFEVEQQVNGVFLNFFGFNGSAGVWRIKALEESGGWLDRTTAEDMDLAVRAHLKGWKFVFLNDVNVLCELPASFDAYKKQQYRWHSGPIQLLRLCLPAVIESKIPLWKKANLILLYFSLRKLILPVYCFILFCIVLPLSVFTPNAELPLMLMAYIPTLMTVLYILPDPKSIPYVFLFLLFDTSMSITKSSAIVSGLFQLGSSYEWIVTKKAGRSSDSDRVQPQMISGASENNISGLLEQSPIPVKKTQKIYKKELALALLFLTAMIRSLSSADRPYFYILLFQGVSLLLVGLSFLGE